MDKVKEAWAKLERRVLDYAVSVREMGDMQIDEVMDAARDVMLAVHVDSCGFEEFDSEGDWQECGQDGHLCATAKALKELAKEA